MTKYHMKKYRISGDYGIQIGEWIGLEVRAKNADNALRRLIRECKKAGVWDRVGLHNCNVYRIKESEAPKVAKTEDWMIT
jgi:hypothetical protein